MKCYNTILASASFLDSERISWLMTYASFSVIVSSILSKNVLYAFIFLPLQLQVQSAATLQIPLLVQY
jgi:hypothetical protein